LRRLLTKTRVVAVGPKTSNELQRQGVRVNVVPLNYTSEGVVEALKPEDLKGKRILIPRAKGAPKYLSTELEKLGAIVEEFFIYEPAQPSGTRAVTKFARDLSRGVIGAMIFTSSSTVKNFFNMTRNSVSIGRLKRLMKNNMDIIAIGPVTARTLEEAGVKPRVVPRRFLAEEALEALVRYYRSHSGSGTRLRRGYGP